MTPTGSSHPDERWGTFQIFRTDAASAEAVAEAVTLQLRSSFGDLPGLLAVQVQIELGGAAVVCRGQWAGPPSSATAQSPAAQALGQLAELPGVQTVTRLSGIPAEGLEGPAAGRPAGIAVVAIRHLAGQESAAQALKLLGASGEWKKTFPGFISATPYFSEDGTIFVNYPTWVDEPAYRAWMADPRIASAKAGVAELDTSSPEFLTCRVTADISAKE
jgi:Antibiotic biosynthesis monooxygenase